MTALYELVNTMYRYDVETGHLIRRYSMGGKFVGSVAGSIGSNGYIQVSVKGVLHRAHRLAWLLSTGRLPDGDIDHIDGDRSNNKLSNLRIVTRAENMQNQRKAKGNSRIGLLGVSANKGRWMARIKRNGVMRHIGTFDTPQQAHAAYIAEKRVFHPKGML